MSLALAAAMRDALDGHEALTLWAAQWNLPTPRLVIGYERPRSAQDWPFVALTVVADRWQLSSRWRPETQSVAVVCGVRWEAQSLDETGGLGAAYGLDEAVMTALAERRVLHPQGWSLVVRQGRLVDYELKHPNYQLERAYEWQAQGAQR